MITMERHPMMSTKPIKSIENGTLSNKTAMYIIVVGDIMHYQITYS